MMYFDPLWFLVMIPGMLLGIWAKLKLMHAYGKYSRVAVDSGRTGAETARTILDRAGLEDVPVEEIPGQLSDHYDPRKRAVFLSSENYHGQSVAAVGVAAHETGHALQHQAAYGLFQVRSAIVPAVQFADWTWYIVIFLGFLLHMFALMALGVVLFSAVTLFQLVTLPVEYDASHRAKEQLFRLGLVHEHERAGVAKVLNAAALTYVAALVGSILQLLYFIIRMQGSRR
jgi:Zn-dependent membrane protease YugP